MTIKDFTEDKNDIIEISEQYLGIDDLAKSLYLNEDESYADATWGKSVPGLEQSAAAIVDMLEDAGLVDSENEVKQKIAYITAVYYSALEALDIILPDHLERLARLNPDAASDLMSAIYGDREGGIGED